MMDHITVKGQDGTFSAYIARPKTSPASAVGVNADIRKHCDELAEQGYLAVAPDLYWRQESGAGATVAEAKGSHAIYVSQPEAVADLIAQAAEGEKCGPIVDCHQGKGRGENGVFSEPHWFNAPALVFAFLRADRAQLRSVF